MRNNQKMSSIGAEPKTLLMLGHLICMKRSRYDEDCRFLLPQNEEPRASQAS